ncbi:hypothetical protein ACQ4PT_060015 [Festuca glaucescens]
MGVMAMSLLCSLLAVLMIAVVSASDEAALLAFKAQLSDGGSLASWNSSTNFCSWEGVACSHRRPARVVALSLNGSGLTGALSPALGNLTFLRKLDLSYNWFHGEIPASPGRLRRLQRLDLYDNSFSGMLPVNLSSCISMTTMGLHDNKLGGRIPAELGEKLVSLEALWLSNNSFTGPIPASLGNLSYLQDLQLNNNQLVGSIPAGLGSIWRMQRFSLFNNNISGTIPLSLYNWSSIESFDVGINMLYGSIPDDIGNKFPKMSGFDLGGNQFTGTIPSSISNLSFLTVLGLSGNKFSGYVPTTLGRLAALQSLSLSDHMLEVNDNKGWEFITSLVNCSQLQNLVLGGYSFGGQLPASITNLSTTLQQLTIADNRVPGSIPADIGNLIGLNRLQITNTFISGEIPESIGKLSNMIELGNQLSGKIPDSIQKCVVLEWLLLDNNSFEGSIPQSFKNLKGLNKLNLTMNKFSGNIPESLGSIENLQELYLAHNKLSGSIPTVLKNLTSLSKLDVSFNNLQGEVPGGGVFRNITYTSVAGNINLCGGTPKLHLAPCSTSSWNKKKRKMSKSLVVFLATTGAILSSFSVILLFWILRKKLKKDQKTIVQCSIVEDHYERIPYHALLRGTNGFSDDNLLGRGSYGAVFKCILANEERTLAVKVFNLGQSRYSKSFEAECEAMRTIRHRYLIKIITSCSSVNNQGQEFKAMDFEFMSNGNLDGWIHPKYQEPSANNTLSLVRRLEIAVNILDAVEYLHNYCQPLVIHCDLKPSNILLADDMSARVGDFGISRIIQENTSGGMQNSYSSMGIRGSIGYVAPEYGESSAVSPPGDIYSLGILLLEMFTGKSPTDDTFRDSLGLHKFAADALPDRTLEIVDPTIWLHGEPHDNVTSRIKECLVSVFRLGISCSKQQPRDRTLARDAAAEMHAIRDAYIAFVASL